MTNDPSKSDHSREEDTKSSNPEREEGGPGGKLEPTFRIKFGSAGTTVPSVSEDEDDMDEPATEAFAPYKAGPATGTEGVTGLPLGRRSRQREADNADDTRSRLDRDTMEGR